VPVFKFSLGGILRGKNNIFTKFSHGTIVVENVFYVFYFSIKCFNDVFILCMFFLFLKTFIILTWPKEP